MLLGFRENERTAESRIAHLEKMLTAVMEQLGRANEDQRVRKAPESEAKCAKCREFVSQVAQLGQECDKLQKQFNSSQETVVLLEKAVSYILVCYKTVGQVPQKYNAPSCINPDMYISNKNLFYFIEMINTYVLIKLST